MRSLRFVLLAMVAVGVGCGGNSADGVDASFRPQCADGVDNDGDGATDFPDDAGCESADDDDETATARPQCSDNRDNDGDGKIDYPFDPGCIAPQVDDETDGCPGEDCPQCGDGIDNDNNGKIDYPDDSSGCMSAADPLEFTDDPNACGQGMVIKPLPLTGTDTGMLVGTTSSVSSPCGGGSGLPAVAYIFHLSVPRVMVATTDQLDTAIDTVLDLRASMCSMSGAEVACHDDIAPGTGSSANKKSKITQSLPAGTYYLIVGGKTSGDTGMYSLKVNFLAGEGASCGTVDDCGPGLVCRVPVNQTQTLCSRPVCDDGKDDDGDGAIDYPNDPGCASPTDDTEDDVCGTNPQSPQCPECSNGIDDDGDGDIDYMADPNCMSAGSTSESCVQSEPVGVITQMVTTGTTVGAVHDYKPACNTSNTAPDVVYRLDLPTNMATLSLDLDANYDAVHALLSSTCENPAIDCKDPDLLTSTNLAAGTYYVVIDGWAGNSGTWTLTTTGTIAGGESCEGPLAIAGAFTCEAGYTCGGMPGSRTCVPGPCSDGIDNDGDGKSDIADPGCSSVLDDDEADDCSPTVGPNCPECSDGIDNDGDGNIDYPADTSCLRASSNSEACKASEPVATITQSVTMGTNVGQVNDYTPSCNSSNTAPDVTYRLDLPEMATLKLDVSGFDTVQILLDSTCGGTAVTCSDAQTVSRTDVAAGTYYFVIDGWAGNTGAYTLTTTGTVKPGGSCEGALFQSGAFTCTTGYACNGPMGSRTCVLSQCNDTIDNDGDGKTDAADPGCTGIEDNDELDDCYPTVGPNCPACADGMDNDGDGTTDFPNDLGCLRPSGTSEMCPQTEPTIALTMASTMGTTVGQVHDVKVDCSSSSNTAPDLSYRLDLPGMQTLKIDNSNSFDAVVALYDATCGGKSVACSDEPENLILTNLAAGTYYYVVDGWTTQTGPYTINVSGTIMPGESCESPLAQSGAISCPANYPCSGTPGMRRCLGMSACTDGVDNDGDGKTDFPMDPGCTSITDPDESDSCYPVAGPDCPQCGNGIDDDLDMQTDFPADTRCPSASFFREAFCTKEVGADILGVITSPTTTDTLAGRGDDYDQSCQSNTANDVVYALVLPVPVARLQIDTLGSAGDTVLSLWNALCTTEIECDDDGGGGFKSLIKRSNVPAGDYAIQVDAYNASANNTTFNLNVRGTVAPGTVCTDPLFAAGVLVCATGTTCTGGTCQ